MIRGAQFLALSALLSQVTVQAATGSCSSSRGDCLSNDLAKVTGYSAADCCASCRARAGCGAAVFVDGGQFGNTCYLKTSCNPTSGCVGDSCTTVIVGGAPSPSPGGMCSSSPGDCEANDITSMSGASADDCCTACQGHAGCGAAVFVEGGQYGNTCYLKTTCNPIGGCVGDSCTVVIVPSPSPPSGKNWYDGIDSIKVLHPGDSMNWGSFYESTRQAQFDDARYAILLTAGQHDAQIGVGFYTSIIGVGSTRHDVIIDSFYSLDLNDDGSGGGATQNFWRSVEGVTATNPSLTWATSQACPIRRSVVRGDLVLSELGEGTHWSSGGYISDIEVQGSLDCGTQQQFFFRNSKFDGSVSCSGLSNGAFVGTIGQGDLPSHVSHVGATPTVAEKPFLVESNRQWHIAVPNLKSSSSGTGDDSDVTKISMDNVFVAEAKHSAAEINNGIQGKRALLFTPGIYSLAQAVYISQAEFVVLGIGFPTLISKNGQSAIVVEQTASNVRIGALLFEAGTTTTSQATAAMLLWKGSHGIGSDIFSRVGSFSARGCAVTRADVHVQVIGSNTILDNTWLWHADHDDCNRLSDQCYDKRGLQVDGASVTVYGLKVEHTLENLVQWNGDDGSVFFYQAELPYHAPNFGSSGFSGYVVNDGVSRHRAVALGVYIVYDEMTQVTAFRVPRGLDVQNIFGWCITGPATQFADLICVGDVCYAGDCSYDQCRMSRLPSSSTLI